MCRYVCICIEVCMYMYVCICMQVCMYVCMYMYAGMYVYVCAYVYMYVCMSWYDRVHVCAPPLWSSCQSSWLQIRRPGFDSRHYQKKKVVGLERGPLNLVSTTEELLDRKVAAPVYKIENTVIGIRHADHVAPSIRKCWQSLRRQTAVARSV
jgi:hypothetical protein